MLTRVLRSCIVCVTASRRRWRIRITCRSIAGVIALLVSRAQSQPNGGDAGLSVTREIVRQLSIDGDSTADRLARLAVQETESRYGPSAPQTEALLNDLVRVFEAGERTALAREHSRRFVALCASRGTPRALAMALGRHGRLCRSDNAPAAAADTCRLALQWAEQIVGFEDSLRAEYLNDLGVALNDQWRLQESLPHLQRALGLRRRAPGGHSMAIAMNLRDIASVHWRLGNLALARHSLDSSLAICERIAHPDSVRLGSIYNLDAILLSDAGRTQASLRRFQQCLSLARERSRPKETARCLQNIGVRLARWGRHQEATLHYDSALTIRRRIRDHGGITESHLALGAAALALGNLDEAERRFSGVLNEQRRSRAPDVSLAGSMAWIAQVQFLQRRYAEAESVYAAVARLRRRSLPAIHPNYAFALIRWGEAKASLGDTAGALTLVLEADSLVREHMRIAATGLSQYQLLGVTAARPPSLDLALSMAAASSSPRHRGAAFDAVIRGRGQILDQLIERRRFTARTRDSASAADRDSLLATQNQLAAELIQRSGRGSLVDALITQRDMWEGRLAASSARLRSSITRRETGIADVANALRPNTALVAYVRYRESRPGRQLPAAPAEPGTSADTLSAYAAFVLLPSTSGPEMVPLGRASLIDSLVRRWCAHASSPFQALDRARQEVETLRAGRALAAAVWDPVARRIGDPALVFLVPAAALSLVNFSALTAPDGSHYLAETGAPLHVLSAERDLIRYEEAPPGQGLLAVAHPDFGFASARAVSAACPDFSELRFSALPATRDEAQDVIAAWDSVGRSPGESTPPSLLLTGSEATEAAFLRGSGGSRILHLATHGYFLRECRDSTVEALALNASPLLRSGLGLAGANRRSNGASTEDGLLTAEEIASSDLSGVEWAVLSACDTGLGDIHRSEGVLGLRRAFALAGVRTTIMSLWRVEDRATQTWMHHLYVSRLERGRSTAEACRDASLEVLRRARARGETTHPSRWGAFVATGDWR